MTSPETRTQPFDMVPEDEPRQRRGSMVDDAAFCDLSKGRRGSNGSDSDQLPMTKSDRRMYETTCLYLYLCPYLELTITAGAKNGMPRKLLPRGSRKLKALYVLSLLPRQEADHSPPLLSVVDRPQPSNASLCSRSTLRQLPAMAMLLGIRSMASKKKSKSLAPARSKRTKTESAPCPCPS